MSERARWLGWRPLRIALPAAILLVAGVMAARPEDKPSEPPAALVPPPPEDAALAKVYAVLDRHCAHCHQSGRLQIPRAAKDFANILELDAIARTPTLVRPGTPDASRLYTQMLAREMPYDFYHDGVGEEPAAEDVQIVRDWIQALPPRPALSTCADRQPIAQSAIDEAIASHLQALPPERRKEMRFISLAHLHNACVPLKSLDAYREAVSRIVNSLSWSAAVHHPEPVDKSATVLMIDLAAIGWVAGHWDQLVKASADSGLIMPRSSEAVRLATGSATPVLNGDWLAATALKAPLYHSLLGLPGRQAELYRVLNLDVEAGVRSGQARRAGLRDSQIIAGNRVAERHALKSGSLWQTYDFAGSSGRQSILEHPLGPGPVQGQQPFRPDSSRVMFSLPNGFLGFAQYDARGERIDVSPAGVDRDTLKWADASGTGRACMGCHTSGPIRIHDAVRAAVEADRVATKEMRDAVLALYAPGPELDRLLEEDIARYRAAQASAGVRPDLRVEGLDPVTALAREYERDVTAVRAAAEAGLTEAEFRKRLGDLTGAAQVLAMKLRQGDLSRPQLARLLAAMGRDGSPPTQTAEGALDAKPGSAGDIGLTIWSDREVYPAGSLATFHALADSDCHLTLVSIDKSGKATVLFPNEFEQNNQLLAGKEVQVPGQGAPYQFRLKDKGRETLVGVCTLLAKTADGIHADYERQRFTMLGNWRNFLSQAMSDEGGERRAQSDPKQAEPKARNRRKPRGKPSEPAGNAAATTPKPRERQGRTAVVYDVE